MQIKLPEFPLQPFRCPVSKEMYKDKFKHEEFCTFRYCKEGKWIFSFKV